MLVLLFLFNPIVSSLRAIQQASCLKKVQKKLGCARVSLGSLSESSHVFEPELLKEIIAELGAQLQPVGRDARLKHIRQTLTLVDGSLLAALPSMAEASWLKGQKGSGLVKWRRAPPAGWSTHFEVDRYVPTRIDVTRDGGGVCDERTVMGRVLESDRLYVMDRGYAKFKLFNAIIATSSSYVCRIRDNSQPEILEERPLTNAASLRSAATKHNPWSS